MRTLFHVCAVLLLSASVLAECPTADLSGDCKIGLADLAVLAGQWEGEPNMPLLYDMASQWMTEGIRDIVFIDIPGGTFQMGDNFSEGHPNELPVHTVTISTFKMSKYETTNAQYAEYLNAVKAEGLIKVVNIRVYAVSDDSNSYPYCYVNSYSSGSQIDFSGGVFTVRSKSGRSMINDPVVVVSWYGAKAFCDYYGYRLPTEAEWEYAARGGFSDRRFPWGDTINHNYANYGALSAWSYDTSQYGTLTHHPIWSDGVYPYTSPVGSFSGNGYGLHDMVGNVKEWCSDRFGSYPSDPQTNPTGSATGDYRVNRGGSWADDAARCRVAARSGSLPFNLTSMLYGFRVCLDLN